jgi:hypothetical protein
VTPITVPAPVANRDLICAAAAKVYSRGGKGSCHPVSAAF